jgi:hypothetical protein
MLVTPQNLVHLEFSAQQYLRDTLGFRVESVPFVDSSRMPYFLQEAFEFRQLRLNGESVFLAIERGTKAPIGTLRTQLAKAKAILDGPVVYVVNSLASYERKRLIEQKVPFIVPGNQMYLPDLGIDLREYFRRKTIVTEDTLSPATQAVLVAMLWRRPWQRICEPTVLAMQLGYSQMTLSRAMRELEAASVVTQDGQGRQRRLLLPATPLETWQLSQRYMRSPVRRRFWTVADHRVPPGVRKAGLTALAELSSLAEPTTSCYAIDGAQRRGLALGGDHLELPEASPGSIEWQVWSYSPAMLPDCDTVDPISLFLSLKDESDERVQMALGELKEHLPW